MAFCSRALIPAGFMPGPGGLMICPSYASLPSAASTGSMSHDMPGMDMSAMDMVGMDMSHDSDQVPDDGGSSRHEGSPLCPFAAAAVPMASSLVTVILAVVHDVTLRIDLPYQAVIPRDAIAPTRLPRGPPSFA